MDNRTKQAEYRRRMRERGLVQVPEWVPAEHRGRFRLLATALREGVPVTVGEVQEDARAHPGPVPPVRGNPAHQALFAIPTPTTSDSTALSVPRPLPEQTRITGDLEVDAVLWLRQICKTATDTAALDLALEGAKRITTPPNELEKRYSRLMVEQGAHPMQAALGSFNLADIGQHVSRARQRIEWTALGLAVFGSYEATMGDTPPERMLARTAPAALPDGDPWRWTDEQRAGVFAASVNPATLSEAVDELRYWRWLHDIRRHADATQYPGSYAADETVLVAERQRFVEFLLCELPPVGRAEAAAVADALPGLGFDFERENPILRHLIG